MMQAGGVGDEPKGKRLCSSNNTRFVPRPANRLLRFWFLFFFFFFLTPSSSSFFFLRGVLLVVCVFFLLCINVLSLSGGGDREACGAHFGKGAREKEREINVCLLVFAVLFFLRFKRGRNRITKRLFFFFLSLPLTALV